MTDAATSLASLGSTIDAAHAASAAPTTTVVSAAADEVSAAIAAVFSEHGSAYQALSAQAAAFHTQLVQTLNAGAGAYAAAEAANAGPLQTLEQQAVALINAPTETLVARPLIGNGFDGTTNAQGVGTPGGGGGILWGNGGHGGASTATGMPGGAGGPAGLIGTGGTGGMGGFDGSGGVVGTGGLLWGNGGIGGLGGPTGIGGAGGNALFFGNGGMGGQGGTFTASVVGGSGGAGGAGGLLWGGGGAGGTGGPYGPGGTGGSAQWFGNGGEGGIGGAFANGGAGGNGGHLIGAGGAGGTGGIDSGIGGPGGAGAGLWGHAGVTGAPGGAASVPLDGVTKVGDGGRPTVAVNVNDGPIVEALVDTGSTTALFPLNDVNLQSLRPAGHSDTLEFGPPEQKTVDYYTTYTAELNFGNGMVTKPMTIGVITKETVNGVLQTPHEAVIGVGANTAHAPDFSTSPVQELPGALDEGVLVNEHATEPYLQFGPNPATPFASVTGAPYTNDLLVSVNNGPLQSLKNAIVDTGGLGGNMPENLVPGHTAGQYLPQGTELQIDAINPQGGMPQQLYTETLGANAMLVTGSQDAVPNPGWFNTGNYVFTQMPVYFSYSPSGGTIEFDPA